MYLDATTLFATCISFKMPLQQLLTPSVSSSRAMSETSLHSRVTFITIDLPLAPLKCFLSLQQKLMKSLFNRQEVRLDFCRLNCHLPDALVQTSEIIPYLHMISGLLQK